MTTPPLSEACMRLLQTTVNSQEKLDLLLKLAMVPDQTASIFELAQATGLPPSIARKLVGELDTARIVEVNSRGMLRFSVKNTVVLDELLGAYQQTPSIIKTILERIAASTRRA